MQNLIYEKITYLTMFYYFYHSINAEIVNKVLVNNNDRISDETIITYGEIEIGKNYNENDLNEILKNLYRNKFF